MAVESLKPGRTRLAALGLLLAGGAMIAASRIPGSSLSHLLRFLEAGFAADVYAARLQRFSSAALLAGVLLLGLGLLLMLGGRRLAAPLSRFWARLAASYRLFGADLGRVLKQLAAQRESLIWLLALTLLGLALRAWFLSQPMRYDEAHSYLAFVSPRTMRLFFYGQPNNHVAHSLAVSLSTALLGSEPWAIRLPAFVAGMLLIPATYLCARTVFHPRAGVLAAALVAGSPLLVFYSTNARGYSGMALLSVLLVPLTLYMVRRESIFAALVFGLMSALGLYTMPTMFFPMAMLLVWVLFLAFHDGGLAKTLRLVWLTAGALLVSGVTTLILYAPVIVMSGLPALLSNSWVTPLSLPEAAQAWPGMVQATWLRYARDVPGLVWLILGAFALVGLIQLWRANRRTFYLLPAALFGNLGVLLLMRVVPFFRVWIFLLPLLLCLADAGLMVLLGRLGRRSSLRVAGVLGLLFALGISIHLISTGAVARYPETGVMPDAEAIARYLQPRLEEGDRVLARNPANLPLRYYALKLGVPLDVFRAGGSGDVYVVVQQPRDTFERVVKGAELTLDEADFDQVRYPSAILYVPRE